MARNLTTGTLWLVGMWFVASAQTLVFPSEDFTSETGILYVTPQGYVSGSQPQIVGYQIVASDNYADQQVSSLSYPAQDSVQPGLRYSQQQHYGQQAQLYSGADVNLQTQASNTYGQYSGVNANPQPQAINTYAQYSGANANLQPQASNTYGQYNGANANLQPQASNRPTYEQYGGTNVNLQPHASNSYGQYSDTNTNLQPQASNTYGHYSGTGNLQPQNNNQRRAISRQRQHQVGRISRLPTVDTGNYQSQTSNYNTRNGGRALHGSRKPNQYQNRRSRNKQQSDDASHVPVYVPISFRDKKEKTKKVKTVTVSRGFYIAGGNQLYGKFKTLKACQRACDRTPNCFAGDYDRTTYRCYTHDSQTACDSMSPHKILTHFKKIPCSVAELGISNGQLTLGSNLFNGLLQKGVKDIQTCIKKCLQAGGGVAPSHETAASTPQLCFGIDYDFATHKCFHHTSATVRYFDANLGATRDELLGIDGGIVCDATTGITATARTANSNVVNIIICPEV